VQQQPQHGKAQSQSHRHLSGGRRPRSTPQDDDDDAEESSDDSVSAAAPVGMECDSSRGWRVDDERQTLARASAAHVHDADAESSDNERSTVLLSPSPSPLQPVRTMHNAGSRRACRKHQTSIASISVVLFEIETNTALTCTAAAARPPTRCVLCFQQNWQQMAAPVLAI